MLRNRKVLYIVDLEGNPRLCPVTSEGAEDVKLEWPQMRRSKVPYCTDTYIRDS